VVIILFVVFDLFFRHVYRDRNERPAAVRQAGVRVRASLPGRS
jgi:hypothetical protein